VPHSDYFDLHRAADRDFPWPGMTVNMLKKPKDNMIHKMHKTFFKLKFGLTISGIDFHLKDTIFFSH
jgi:hypothetical protein